jgi:predicted RNA-binding protein YlqC (UPF0109 family)
VKQLQELLLFVARELADEPDKVEVSGEENGTRVNLTLRVAKGDMGRMIGRQGRTIKAVRSVLKAASVPLNLRVFVEVSEAEVSGAASEG